MEKLTKIWKQFIITLSSIMLLNMSFVYNVEGLKFSFSNSAYAQESTNTKGSTGTINMSDGGGNFLTDSSTALLVFIATAIVIYKLTTSCSGGTPWDLYGAALGAGIFIVGELMAIMQSKEELSNKAIEYKTRGEDGQIDDEQYAALLKEKEMMDSISESAEKRSKMQNAAAVVFAGSAALAFFAEVQNQTLTASCTAAASSSLTCAPTIIPLNTKQEVVKNVPQPSVTKYGEIKVISAGIAAGGKSCVAEAEVALATAEAATPVSAAVVAAAYAELTKALGAETACSMKVAWGENNDVACVLSTNPLFGSNDKNMPGEGDVKSFYASVIDMIIPKAEAAGMGDLLKGIAGAIAGYYIGQSTMINSLITTPNHRAILWGSLAAYGYMVASNTKDTAKTAKENAEKINKILKKMDRSRASVQMNTKLAGASAANLGRQINIGRKAQELGTTFPCSNGSSKDSNGNVVCNPAPFTTNSSFSGSGGFPSAVAPLMQAAGRFVGSTQGGSSVSDGSMANIDTINGQQSAINGLLDKAKKNLNKTLLSSGKKPVDFNKQQNQVMKGLANAVKSGLNKSGTTGPSLLARMGYGPQSESANKKETDVAEAAKEITASVDKNSGKGLEAKKPGFDFDFSAGNTDAIVAAKNEEFDANAAAANADAEIKDDIIQDKSVSIFKVISIRYKKSGFKRLLDEL
ncbi:hypothetical protein [Bacteriovorax sp. Seq25_V]|uniref:hypothetical protein n=1 Tax=Bacteriovorax sp. Seq25_V TaxID=1201288 RepID=UPI000389F808|nr:hypothetical protein [Bacteriovorax sp. Seq25_V]EQC47420.1 hypothetical protein M900_0755 [Bacteriovorax sp. Seq25_V]